MSLLQIVGLVAEIIAVALIGILLDRWLGNVAAVVGLCVCLTFLGWLHWKEIKLLIPAKEASTIPSEPPSATVNIAVELTSWGINPPFIAWGVIDAQKLYPYRDKYKLMLIIKAADHTIDPLDDKNIQKSAIFDISSGKTEIDITMNQELLHHMMALNANRATVDYWMCVLPSGLHIENNFTLREIIQRNGVCQLGGEDFVGGRPFSVR
jgi:hypothetical protein